MTDEEMAEEWVKQEYPTLQITAVAQRYIKAFLAGLKAGRPEWHDMRKDPNDLPKNKRNVWCDYGDDYGKGFYDKDDCGWWIEGHMFCSIINAWCELPTFTDKE